MLKAEEQRKRLDSVHKLSFAALHAYVKKSRTYDKLRAFNTWFEPPANIRKSVAAQAERLFEESLVSFELYKKLNRVADKLLALPSWDEIEYYGGRKGTLIYKGMLPNFEPTSENEAEALQMLADYYKAQSA